MNKRLIIRSYRFKILFWAFIFSIISILLLIGPEFGINKKAILLVTVILGIFTEIFAGITSFIALIPFFGPFIIKVISIPIFYILNAIGWVVSAVAIKKGYTNELSKSRTVTLALLIGIIIGYIIGNILPLK